MADTAFTSVNDVPQDAADDTLFSIGTDLESSIGRVECLAALLNRMGDDAGEGQDALILFHILYTVQAIHEEQAEIFHRLWAKVTEGRSDGRAQS